MAKITINETVVELNNGEEREVKNLQLYISIDKAAAQRIADIWMRSANNDRSAKRRKAAVKALGLSDEIKFL